MSETFPTSNNQKPFVSDEFMDEDPAAFLYGGESASTLGTIGDSRVVLGQDDLQQASQEYDDDGVEPVAAAFGAVRDKTKDESDYDGMVFPWEQYGESQVNEVASDDHQPVA